MAGNCHYDAIIAGGGHGGLTVGACLARAGPCVRVIARCDIVGGAGVSQSPEPGRTCSNCFHVCSLLRPEIARDLDGASERFLELEAAFDDWKEGGFSAQPHSDMLIPIRIDPTMAPPGAHMAFVFVRHAPHALERGVLDKIAAVTTGAEA